MSYSFCTGFSVSRKVPGTEQVLRKWWPSDSVNEQMSSPLTLSSLRAKTGRLVLQGPGSVPFMGKMKTNLKNVYKASLLFRMAFPLQASTPSQVRTTLPIPGNIL